MGDERSKNTIKDFGSSGLTHECGVFGAVSCSNVTNSSDIAQIICVGLEALQHRYVNVNSFVLHIYTSIVSFQGVRGVHNDVSGLKVLAVIL